MLHFHLVLGLFILFKDKHLHMPWDRFLNTSPKYLYTLDYGVKNVSPLNNGGSCSLTDEACMLGVEKTPWLDAVAVR